MLSMWVQLHPLARPEVVGLLPAFIRATDPRPLAEQINERYAHGGGWQPIPGFTLDHATLVLQYPEDPPLAALFMTRIRDEEFIVYSHGMCVIRKGNEFEVARLD